MCHFFYADHSLLKLRLHDRITGTNAIPPLAELVTKAAKELNLGQGGLPPDLPPTY